MAWTYKVWSPIAGCGDAQAQRCARAARLMQRLGRPCGASLPPHGCEWCACFVEHRVDVWSGCKLYGLDGALVRVGLCLS